MILLTASMVCSSHGQGFGVYVGGGGGTYRMDDLKYYQEYLLDNFPVEGKMISLYPPYLNTSVGFFKEMTDFIRLGIEYTFASTGARASYSDFSGYRLADQIFKSHLIGFNVKYLLSGGDRFELLGSGTLSASYNLLEISESILTNTSFFGTYYDAYSINYRSFSPQISAGLQGLVHFGKYAVGLDAGYCLDIGGELRERDDPDYKLTDPANSVKAIYSDWSGFRVGLKLLISFN